MVIYDHSVVGQLGQHGRKGGQESTCHYVVVPPWEELPIKRPSGGLYQFEPITKITECKMLLVWSFVALCPNNPSVP